MGQGAIRLTSRSLCPALSARRLPALAQARLEDWVEVMARFDGVLRKAASQPGRDSREPLVMSVLRFCSLLLRYSPSTRLFKSLEVRTACHRRRPGFLS